MSEFFSALIHHHFLQVAVAAGLLASVGCGMMGTFVVVKRIAFLAGGIAHTVLAGMGAAIYYQFDLMLGALVAALSSALLIGLIRLHWRAQEDTLVGALWAIGMAVGVLFISQSPGYSGDLLSYLFGNILLVPSRDLWIMGGLDAVLLVILGLYYRQLLAISFDEEFALLRGVPVKFFYLLLLCLIAVTVVLLVQVVGLILVIALLTLPAAIAGQYLHSLSGTMVIAVLLGMVFTTGGLAISYGPDLPAGPMIILVAAASYVISALYTKFLGLRKSRQAVLASLS